MGSGNLINSGTSSEEEIDQQPDKVSDDDDMDDTAGVGRSYECTFCKRGFTNAQALGGHMNIHRKDKAIAKARAKSKLSKDNHHKNHHHQESSSMFSNKSYTPISSHDDEQHQYAAAAVGAYMGYPVYYPSSNNPRYLHGYHHHHHYDFMTSPGVPDQSLSLRLGSTPTHDKEEDDDEEERLNKTDIDLELRLGH